MSNLLFYQYVEVSTSFSTEIFVSITAKNITWHTSKFQILYFGDINKISFKTSEKQNKKKNFNW